MKYTNFKISIFALGKRPSQLPKTHKENRRASFAQPIIHRKDTTVFLCDQRKIGADALNKPK